LSVEILQLHNIPFEN